jgi:hypothetical protein
MSGRLAFGLIGRGLDSLPETGGSGLCVNRGGAVAAVGGGPAIAANRCSKSASELLPFRPNDKETCQNFRSLRGCSFKGIVSRDFSTLFLISLDRFKGRNRAGSGFFHFNHIFIFEF